MAARKKKRELSEKAQKRIRQRNLHVGITVIAAIVIIFSVIQARPADRDACRPFRDF